MTDEQRSLASLSRESGANDGATSRHVDVFAHLQAAIDGWTEDERRIVLLRLAKDLNNGDEHFDHGPVGYSWLCHRCALNGDGGLNGWVGARRSATGVEAP